MTVIDASAVVRLLQNKTADDQLRARVKQDRFLHAPALLDAEVTSAIRGLLLTSKPNVAISAERAKQMLDDFADLPVVRHPMRTHQHRVLTLRANFTAYDAFYVALSESLELPLLTDDRKFAKVVGNITTIEECPAVPESG